MAENRQVNLEIVEKIALALGEINDEVIYVGGAVISLYVTDETAEQPRPTMDIDISVQISSYSQMDQFRERLARKNIYPAPSETVTYRFIHEDILIDFIPFEETWLGPTNRWLKPGFKEAYPVTIGKATIKILPISYFLATKWEAFKNRGDDPRMSHDFEDIIYILDNNSSILDDIASTDQDVQLFLKEMSKEILSHSSLNEIIECHLNPFEANERREFVIKILKQIEELSLEQ